MRQIFISYSTHDDLTKAVRNRLIEKLRGLGLTPLVDENIDPGDPWRAKLHYWLGSCDGAVLLFSREALDSPWVRKEATILTWRKSQDPRLRIVPVPLGDVSHQELTQGYLSSLEVGESEWVRISGEAAEQELDTLVEKIARVFAKPSLGEVDSGLRRWIERAASALRNAKPEDLERAAALLEVREEDLHGLCEPAVVVAHQLLHTGLDSSLPALSELMADLPRESRETLARLVEPLWVQEEAARHILPVTRRPETKRLLAINARFEDTGEWYIHRATCGTTGTWILRTSGTFGEDQVTEIVAAFVKGFYRLVFGTTEGLEYPAPERERLLQKGLRKLPRPVFLLVRGEGVCGEVLEALRNRFPTVTLVLLSGSALPDRDALGIPDLELVRPALGIEEEEDAIATVLVVRRLAELVD